MIGLGSDKKKTSKQISCSSVPQISLTMYKTCPSYVSLKGTFGIISPDPKNFLLQGDFLTGSAQKSLEMYGTGIMKKMTRYTDSAYTSNRSFSNKQFQYRIKLV